MEDFDLDIFTRMRGKSLDDFGPRLRQSRNRRLDVNALEEVVQDRG